MGAMSKAADSLPDGFGYVVMTGVGSVMVQMWMAINVGKARKQYEVKYPRLYHEEPDHIFNCIQRAHQHTIENSSTFLFLLLTSGLQYPRISSVAGMFVLAGRVAFALGYYTGKPENRRWGGFAHVGELLLLGGTVSLIFHELRWFPCN